MRANRLAGGLVILLIGLMFLLANMGVLDLSVWALVFRFWPVLLIVGGPPFGAGVPVVRCPVGCGDRPARSRSVVWGWATAR